MWKLGARRREPRSTGGTAPPPNLEGRRRVSAMGSSWWASASSGRTPCGHVLLYQRTFPAVGERGRAVGQSVRGPCARCIRSSFDLVDLDLDPPSRGER
ncbi:hypothetical protein MPTK1_8g16580 [Marchantia polymorpha subsp. ruderalis]|uniref:Uncharacterized protein n=1 Tax=Marchantia polymorpha TaxID=3197 RepID=A0A2R6W4I3_MARPO|nr:hypothetical protein MARPO_0154s0006 [Marchantia polymorpha]BBN20118.1 hypothetical protein Mp_8g16580 [Marchantia polymorpha subsp. ruderalis]|eukprot:PTQ28776.1 hypothetical protein MARPO_0154s0006 [Marchantia polymorpha]